MRLFIGRGVLLAALVAVTGCGAGKFDIPSDEGGPTVRSIVNRIQCELVSMVKDDYPHQQTMLTGNYNVGVALSLTVNDAGELAPSFNFPSVTSELGIAFGARVGRTRERNFTQNLFFSMSELRTKYEYSLKSSSGPGDKPFASCPRQDTNLAGNLGLVDTVNLAMTAGYRATAKTLDSPTGEFGGSISFTVTKNINSAGPTWTLNYFEGPGKMGRLEHVNTDKITFAFAPGATGPDATVVNAARIREILLQIYIQDRRGL